MKLDEAHRLELQRAKVILENPGIASRISNYVGTPIEKGFEQLPKSWSRGLQGIIESALASAADVAIFTMTDAPKEVSSDMWHKVGVAASGGVGGFFGLAAIPAELPISTAIILRSVADIARSEGESVAEISTKLACLEVFAFGGDSDKDEGAETGYYAVRGALAKAVSEAAEHLARGGVSKSGSPALVRLIARISQYFGVQISQKTAAQAIPAIGAAGGAIINTIFIDHYQSMARGHFTVRRLERIYGADLVRGAYQSIPSNRSID